jgi:long-chain acyl-CoA synthetase
MERVVAPLVAPTLEGTLSDLPERGASEHPDRVAFARRDGAGWSDVTSAEFHRQVRALAKGFVAAGLGVGDRVAIMSKTRYEWTLTDFAAWTAGLVPVPIYETSSAELVKWILDDSGAAAIALESTAHAAIVAEARDDLPGLRDVWQIDSGGLEEVAALGAEVSDDQLDSRRERLDRDSIATIIYTSGTTGRPKGCQLTHQNFMGLTENTVERLAGVVRTDGASTLLFLPLAHVFARFIEVLCVAAGARMGHSADIKNLMSDFATFQPTFILAVPRVFEKIYNTAEQNTTAEGKGKIFAVAADTAIAYSEALDRGGPGIALRAKHAAFDRLVFSKLRTAMGGKVEYAVSGGAPLGPRLGHFYRGIGLTILEGYGLTETTAPATVNTPDLIKIGTVGAPLPGVGVRIADDGEVLVKGVNVFASYRGNEQATRDAMRDGWFQTGDLGSLDEDGFLRITGRKKELLVTAGGKNVAPAALEDGLRAHPLISQCMVVGDQKPFIAALVTLDEEMWPTWSKNHGLEDVPFDLARTHEAVHEQVQLAVDEANTAVSRAESIRTFRILAGDFTEENGYLTPSLKLKRNVVMKDFADDVERLYSGPKP